MTFLNLFLLFNRFPQKHIEFSRFDFSTKRNVGFYYETLFRSKFIMFFEQDAGVDSAINICKPRTLSIEFMSEYKHVILRFSFTNYVITQIFLLNG